jgi:hypothetical protein
MKLLIINILKFIFQQLQTNTGFVAIITTITSLTIPIIANHFFLEKNAEIEIRKHLSIKSIDGHEKLIRFMNESRACSLEGLDTANRYPTFLETIDSCIKFKEGVQSFKTNFSHLFNKQLVKEIEKVIDYLVLLGIADELFKKINGNGEHQLKKWGAEFARNELFFLFTSIQKMAEEFLQKGLLKEKINDYITKPRPYALNDAPGVKGTTLQIIFNDLLKEKKLVEAKQQIIKTVN